MFGINEPGKSWRTTLWGIVMIVCGGCVVAGAFIVPAVAVVAIPAGLGFMAGGGGLLTAKDAVVHSTTKEVVKATEEKAASKP